MAFSLVTLPDNVWVEISSGPSEGVLKTPLFGDIRIRQEPTGAPPPNSETGVPLGGEGLVPFSLITGQSIFVKSSDNQTILYVDIY